jgi:predicted dienelactone hydrolase
VYLVTNPAKPAANSSSANWLQPGPFRVAEVDRMFVDHNRPTMANNDFQGAPQRTLNSTLWYPSEANGSHPLIIHSHGFVSNRSDISYVVELLASHGYVVVAADFPLTNGAAPGGPNAFDVLEQPADISFVIDSILALTGSDKPFAGEIDPGRIGLTGYSLGGLTTTLATFHPRLRDRRVSASVSIAGPIAAFTERFYQTTDTPFLAILGTSDALVDYTSHGLIVPERIPGASLLTIAGGAHLGFATVAEPLLRLMDNPDGLGCAAVLAGLGDSSVNDVYIQLGTEAEGVYSDPNIPEVCEIMPMQSAINPGRQQMITSVAVLSFFQSIFATEANDRAEAGHQLAESTSLDFSEVSFTR